MNSDNDLLSKLINTTLKQQNWLQQLGVSSRLDNPRKDAEESSSASMSCDEEDNISEVLEEAIPKEFNSSELELMPHLIQGKPCSKEESKFNRLPSQKISDYNRLEFAIQSKKSMLLPL